MPITVAAYAQLDIWPGHGQTITELISAVVHIDATQAVSKAGDMISRSMPLLVLILYRARTPLMQHGRHGYAALTNGGNDNENGIQQEERGGPQRRIETTYRDEPTEDAGTGTQDPGTDHVAAQGHSESMAVQPSSLQAHENEWRD
ncbi:MAG: hypothetical protein Q9194_002884 [Teloschistes cf. exilis]